MTDAITEATFAELAESGYARLSMEAIARRAGVGKAALYRRWPSKQDMLTELIREAVEDTLPAAPATGALRTDLREKGVTHIIPGKRGRKRKICHDKPAIASAGASRPPSAASRTSGASPPATTNSPETTLPPSQPSAPSGADRVQTLGWEPIQPIAAASVFP